MAEKTLKERVASFENKRLLIETIITNAKKIAREDIVKNANINDFISRQELRK